MKSYSGNLDDDLFSDIDYLERVGIVTANEKKSVLHSRLRFESLLRGRTPVKQRLYLGYIRYEMYIHDIVAGRKVFEFSWVPKFTRL